MVKVGVSPEILSLIRYGIKHERHSPVIQAPFHEVFPGPGIKTKGEELHIGPDIPENQAFWGSRGYPSGPVTVQA